MPNIVDRFGQLVDDAIPKPELARQLLLLGYRAKDDAYAREAKVRFPAGEQNDCKGIFL